MPGNCKEDREKTVSKEEYQSKTENQLNLEEEWEILKREARRDRLTDF